MKVFLAFFGIITGCALIICLLFWLGGVMKTGTQSERDDHISQLEHDNQRMDREKAANKSQDDHNREVNKTVKDAWNKDN